jgi:chorismate mutase/prephenate dehydratase
VNVGEALEELKEVRKELDRVTQQIVRLIEQRVELCEKVAQIKRKANSPFVDLPREEELITKITENSRIKDKSALRRVLREVVSMCRSVQKQTSVALPSAMQSYSKEAAVSIFGSSCSFTTVESVEHAFKLVETGYVDFCVTPYEDTVHGALPSALDALVRHDLKIVAEVVLGIQYHLVSREDSVQAVKTLVADAEAISACQEFVSSTLSHVRIILAKRDVASELSKRKGYAYLVGAYDASMLGLKVLAENVQDSKDNVCRFIALSRPGLYLRTKAERVKHKTTIAFTAENKPGSLTSILSEFSKRGINVTMIVSRPLRTRKWDYAFIVDLEVTEEDPKFVEALKMCKNKTAMLKIFGTYPVVRVSTDNPLFSDWPPYSV